jgi:hypothetical protein
MWQAKCNSLRDRPIPPQEAAMKKVVAASAVVFALALSAFLLSALASVQVQSTPTAMAQDQSAPPPANPADPADSRTFTGKIVKSGDKLVLSDPTDQKVYQLDDQVKAKEFLNKSVRVTGNLDGSTSMIHVTSIDPV